MTEDLIVGYYHIDVHKKPFDEPSFRRRVDAVGGTRAYCWNLHDGRLSGVRRRYREKCGSGSSKIFF
jgi:hypothetical protein